jgi:hypothetical protein
VTPPAAPSSFAAVLAAVRRGQTVGAAARSVGISEELATVMLDEAKRTGLAVSAREACGTCSPVSASALCAGCPVLAPPIDGRGARTDESRGVEPDAV